MTEFASFEVTRIVFDTFYEAGLFEHFEVVFNTLAKALCFEVLVLLIEVVEADFVFNPANDLLTDLLKRKGAELDPEQQFMRLTGNPPAVDTEGIELLSESRKEQYFALHNKDMYWTGERIAEEPDYYRVFVAVEDQRVVGYIDVTWPKSPNYVWDILVAEECRGKGWGRKLLAKAIEMNESGGMELDVNTDNVPAVRLYESMGFTKTEGRNTVSAFWSIPEA